jgi:hypothetical protein
MLNTEKTDLHRRGIAARMEERLRKKKILRLQKANLPVPHDLLDAIPDPEKQAKQTEQAKTTEECDGYKISSHVKLAKPCKARSRIKLCRPRSLPSLSVLVLIIKGSPKVHVSAYLYSDIAVRDKEDDRFIRFKNTDSENKMDIDHNIEIKLF